MASNGTPQSYLQSQLPTNTTRDRSMEQSSTNSGNPYGYVPQNYGNAQQPNAYNPSYVPAVTQGYQPPMLQNGQWSNQQSYSLPSAYGPYSNSGYSLPYYNQQSSAPSGNPYAGTPAVQQQYASPYMPNVTNYNGYNPSQSTGIQTQPSTMGTGQSGTGQEQQAQPAQQSQSLQGMQSYQGVPYNSSPGQGYMPQQGSSAYGALNSVNPYMAQQQQYQRPTTPAQPQQTAAPSIYNGQTNTPGGVTALSQARQYAIPGYNPQSTPNTQNAQQQQVSTGMPYGTGGAYNRQQGGSADYPNPRFMNGYGYNQQPQNSYGQVQNTGSGVPGQSTGQMGYTQPQFGNSSLGQPSQSGTAQQTQTSWGSIGNSSLGQPVQTGTNGGQFQARVGAQGGSAYGGNGAYMPTIGQQQTGGYGSIQPYYGQNYMPNYQQF